MCKKNGKFECAGAIKRRNRQVQEWPDQLRKGVKQHGIEPSWSAAQPNWSSGVKHCSAESQEKEKAELPWKGRVVKEQDGLILGIWAQYLLYKYGESAHPRSSLIIFSHIKFCLVFLVWSRSSQLLEESSFPLQVFISYSSSREARPNLHRSHLSSKLL